MVGSNLKAGRDVALDAKRDIVLQSAENTQTTRGENSSQGGSVGVGLTAGQDTTLKGAQVSGEKVTADVGRNLHLQSEQDKDNYDSKQENISTGASFTYGAGSGSASINASRDKLHSRFGSVNEQTGIFAGKGGFDVRVG
nr:hemagglutinin repeat-containing protein [Xenorhabdus poinarii]